MAESSDYLAKTQKYGRIILVVDILIIIAAFAVSIKFDYKYSIAVAQALIGIIFLAFPYVRHPKWSEKECKTRVRTSGVLLIILGIVFAVKAAGII